MTSSPLTSLGLPRLALLLTALTLSLSAQAHTGDHGNGLASGLIHPFTGMDHLVAMLAVGLWSALCTRRWRPAPLVFVAALAAGAVWAPGFGGASGAEPMIATSLLVMGLWLARPATLPLAITLGAIAVFGWFHGAVHGLALSGAWSLAGMVVASIALHALGFGLGLAMRERQRWLPRSVGAAVACLGLATGWTLLAA